MAHFIACKNSPNVKETIKIFHDNVYKIHGLPRSILSDRGAQFTSELWNSMCKKYNINKKLTRANNSSTNGLVERINRTIKNYLSYFCFENTKLWVDFLSTAEFIYNSTEHSSTGYSPFFIVYRYPPTINFKHSRAIDINHPHTSRRDNIEDILANCRLNLLNADKKMLDSKNDNLPTFKNKFKTGMWVYISNAPFDYLKENKDLAPKFIGPFQIMEIYKTSARLDLSNFAPKKHNIFHLSLLKPYNKAVLLDERTYEVEKILNSRSNKNRSIEYLVKWKKYSNDYNSWVASEDLDAEELIKDFHTSHPNKPSTVTF